ncbi:MAG: restriction endonuclease subunit S [Spirochaetota bacterium]|nr:restriction endonuclease subunit S [Spirochaetota bacterium]
MITAKKEDRMHHLPDGWENHLFNDIVVVKDGTHITPNYIKEGIPFLRVSDIQTNTINLNNVKYISYEEHEILTKNCKPLKGDILYSKNGTVGIAKLINWDWEFSVFVSLAIIKIKANVLINDVFFTVWLNSHIAKKEILKGSKQGTVNNLHLEEIKKFRINLPPLPEQEKIANILSTWDNAIEITEKLIHTKKQQKKALMQKLLTGKTRFKEFGQSATGRHLPDGWEIKEFGNIFSFMKSIPYSRDQLTYNKIENPIYNIHYGDIHANFKRPILDFEKEKNIPIVKNNVILPNNIDYLTDGDLLITDVSEDYTGIGESVEIINIGNRKVTGGLHTFVARDKNNMTNKGYRCYIFKNHKVALEPIQQLKYSR